MNPWALVVIVIGILLIIIGVKDTQGDIASAITGKNKSTSTTSTQKAIIT
jgi:hypothetical protein